MYDVIVIGSGHAGVEAAHISNKLGLKTALITFSMNDIASLPCNVSIGGSAKGIVVRELFALGGMMPVAADENQLQTKILNLSRGPAVRALRTQVDKITYPKWIKNELIKTNIEIIKAEVVSLIITNKKTEGVVLSSGEEIRSKKVIICTGTFLNAKTLMGKQTKQEGPDGKNTNITLSKQLIEHGIEFVRLKTGTPPRIEYDTIDFTKTIVEAGEEEKTYFCEDRKTKKEYENVPAWLTYTNEKTHKLISKNIKSSYLYSSEISGAGPKYCPSIEDKIKHFPNKKRHQIFLEVESKELNTVYVAGLSTSMPKEIQEKFLKTIPGLEKSRIIKYGYSIEYNSINPIQLYPTLESKAIENLYFAGQINGTSGYEEAAAQGLVAAINVNNKLKNKEPFILSRSNSYIGVMIDDLTTKGVQDPYRLLTSRAEFRLYLRHDNARKRLYKIAFENNLISESEFRKINETYKIHEKIKESLLTSKLSKKNSDFKKYCIDKKININVNSLPAINILKRPESNLRDLEPFLITQIPQLKQMSTLDLEIISVELKFEGYLKKQEREIRKYQKYQKLLINNNLDYTKVPNLSSEAKANLCKFKPMTLHQASNISGVNPSDILMLAHFLNKK